jgi:2',3'-cyclic-nucleotide 2'-phosphodiesterase (5'-nucleotidase family)
VITTAGDYKYVGKLLVAFDKAGNLLRWDTQRSGPVRVSGTGADAITPDAEMQAQVVAPVAAFVAELAANVIGQSQVALEGRRGTAPVAPNLTGTAGIRRTETNLGNLLVDSLRWQSSALAPSFGVPQPDVAIQNGGGIRLERVLPAGPITELNTFEIAAFANFLSVVPGIPSSQFKELVENGVSRLPSADGRFVHISGARFMYDITGTAQIVNNDGVVLTPGSRVKDVRLDDGTVVVMNGVPVPGVALDVGTHDFSARGGDQYPFRGAPFTTLGVTYQQGLKNYIESPAGLNGLITAAQYPESNAGGRITCVDGNGSGVAPDCPPE